MKHPLSWQISADGTRMIGHMILKKTVREGVGPTSSAAILGLKVVGGKLLENGGRGALIEKVKKGSTADVEGQLRPGDDCCCLISGSQTENQTISRCFFISHSHSRIICKTEVFVHPIQQ
ncbi:Regulating synaptic membrane exocytosis protein 2 [Blattella germanica]|nr:Regulating synaptic membrane exocytosis protein 2 [Blattella germanica]